MIVYHPARRNFAELANKWDRHIAHDFAEIKSKSLWWPRWMLRAVAVTVSPVAEFGRILVSDRLSGLQARMLAFGGVTRIRLYRGRKMVELALGSQGSQAAHRWNRS